VQQRVLRPRRRARLREADRLLDELCHFPLDPLQLRLGLRSDQRSQVASQAGQRVLLAPLRLLLARAVIAGVAPRVAAQAVGLALDQGWSLTPVGASWRASAIICWIGIACPSAQASAKAASFS
jgi:hypothetical protein